MRIIFLDCDGVLNSHKFFSTSSHDDSIDGLDFGETQLDPQALAILDQIVEETGARIVISSSWRHIWDWQEIAEKFKNRGLQNWDVVIGETMTSSQDNRGAEVKEWLDTGRERTEVGQEAVTSWVIIDDTDEFDSTQHQNFVRTNPKVGLTVADAQKAIQILSRG
jgi:hypothetical protein